MNANQAMMTGLGLVGFVSGWRAMQMLGDGRLRTIVSAATFICFYGLTQPFVIAVVAKLHWLVVTVVHPPAL